MVWQTNLLPNQMTNYRNETDWERADRNIGELLQELRIAIPGVQVLFAFLLAVPFQQRFAQVTDFQQSVYFATLLLAAASTMLLILPTAFHRLTFRKQQKERMLKLSNRSTIAGLLCLSLALIGATVLVTDFLYGSEATAVVGGASAMAFMVLWLVIPLRARRLG
jgi:hypothetical protein